jgi:hypothetical protein
VILTGIGDDGARGVLDQLKIDRARFHAFRQQRQMHRPVQRNNRLGDRVARRPKVLAWDANSRRR